MTDITELRAKKLALENGIVDLIRKFERETGLTVNDVDVASHVELFGDATVAYKANVTATLR